MQCAKRCLYGEADGALSQDLIDPACYLFTFNLGSAITLLKSTIPALSSSDVSMNLCGGADSGPPEEKFVLLRCQSITVAAIAVQDITIPAPPEDIFLGDGFCGVFHVRIENIISVLEAEKVIFAAEFTSCAGGDGGRKRNQE
jgi:hypothetical protein